MNLKALYNLSYGLYVVSSRKGDRFNGQIANTVIQVTSEPPAIAVCINKQNLTHEFIRESKVFTASILAQTAPLKLIGGFGFKSGRDVNKFEGVKYKLGQSGAPVILDGTLGYLEAKLIDSVDAEPLAIIDRKGHSEKTARPQNEQLAVLEQQFRAALGIKKVQISHNARGRGKMVIQFRNHEEFERIQEHICGLKAKSKAG